MALRHLLLGAAALALAAFAQPADAQVALPDVEIEGPIQSIDLGATGTGPGSRTYIGEMKVMGATIRVLEDALIHTPTKTSLDPTDPLTLSSLAVGNFPGRNQPGFIGGTGIIVGESIGGIVYASDVFSDLFEHVVVGEATEPQVINDQVSRSTINGMIIRRITDRRMPAGPAINGFGLRIDANAIEAGTLVAAEGYYVPAQNTLWYHTLEADGAPLLRPGATQVGILRADCRIRGGGRDEIEVRGGVALPADATVQIRVPLDSSRPSRFTTIGVVQAVPDPATSNPTQGLFRADFRNLTIPEGVCPTRVRAVVLAGTGTPNQASATADMEGR